MVMLFCCLPLAAESSIASAERWVFVAKDRGVTIHSREVAGYAESEFKGSLVINQPIEIIGAVLTDIASYTDWFFNCTRATKIASKGSTRFNFLLYIVVEPPWPLWKRDAIYHTSTRVDLRSGIVMVRGEAIKDASVPIKENHVRITDSALTWVLEKLDDTRTEVLFRQRTNVGGKIGSYLSNAGCRKTILESLVNLDRIASKPKYAALGNKLREEFGYNNKAGRK